MTRVPALALVAFVGLSAPAWAQSIVLNGDFSDHPPTNPNGIGTVSFAEDTLTGWIVGGRSIDYYTTYWQEPPGLSNSIDLDGSYSGNQQGALTQMLPTSSGAIYDVSFYFSGNPDCTGTTRVMLVSVDSYLHTYFWDPAVMGNSDSDMKWKLETFSFRARSPKTSIVFASVVPGICGPAIGGVSVVPAN
jgi:hypothetical protein